MGKGACVVAFNPYCTEVIEEKMKCAFIDATYKQIESANLNFAHYRWKQMIATPRIPTHVSDGRRGRNNGVCSPVSSPRYRAAFGLWSVPGLKGQTSHHNYALLPSWREISPINLLLVNDEHFLRPSLSQRHHRPRFLLQRLQQVLQTDFVRLDHNPVRVGRRAGRRSLGGSR